MPRVRRMKPSEEERLAAIAEETGRTIKMAMVRQDVRYMIDLAGLIRMDHRTLSAKLKKGTWTQKDLIKIITILKIPPEDAARMLGASLPVQEDRAAL